MAFADLTFGRCLALALLCASPITDLRADPNDATQEVDLLADGTLDAWRGYNQQEVPDAWKLQDGVLLLDGAGGDLITRAQYDDVDFRFEWKVSEGGNSGVMYRVAETDGPPYHTGPEYQLLDDDRHRDGGDESTSTASLYGLYSRSSAPTRPAGEWNESRIVLRGDHVEHWLNGTQVVDAQIGSDDWRRRVADSKFASWEQFGKRPRGHLALQDHGDRIWFRNLRVRTPVGQPAKARQSGRADRTVRVLLVTQSGGFVHSTAARKGHELSHVERVMKTLAVESGAFRVDCTQDVANDFTPKLIENYDLVMFYTTGVMAEGPNRLPIEESTMQWLLNDWLADQGNAFLGVHCAADTFADYQPYWDMLGGSFDGHPWTADARVTVEVHDPDHPAAAPWGTEFVITDEIYQFKNWQPEKVRVLMSLNMAKTDLKRPYHVPVCWVKQYGAGRVMHMSLGHREDVWTNPTYQQSLLGGIRWLVGDAPGDATPNPDLSARQQQAARQAAAAASEGSSRPAS